MADFYFERDCRTPYSESYTVLEDEQPVGRVDLHFTSTIVHGTLCVLESLTQEAIQELIDTIDEELVVSAGVFREEFIVHIFQGRDLGLYPVDDFGPSDNGNEQV